MDSFDTACFTSSRINPIEMGIKKVERSKAYFERIKRFLVTSEAQRQIEEYNFRQLLKRGIIRQEKGGYGNFER